eukprot:CAMPEP_0176157082 /NCGR_PEP_ID=MMETSP0120_2-20121206/80302_1 /TAXON_ID=160619 /ORGANISM="Kryptoperidinium foliaceum, Strain CCMP 1326" /LENGTH=585 /DNA_ID=CAMNT_0017494337 /DNA_START=22 /DNA_END=1775 /DNA_ORIENTATION=-
MNLRLPKYDCSALQDELRTLEPLQPAPRKTEAAVGAVARQLPRIACSPRVLRAFNWTPPTVHPNAKVAVHALTEEGEKSDAVEPARVVAYLPEEREVLVKLAASGERRIVPMSWVMDVSLGGTERRPWKAGGPRTSPPATAPLPVPPPLPAECSPAAEKGGCDLRVLRAALLQRYGSVVEAWEAIDVPSIGAAGIEAFTRACRPVYRGDLTEAFADLASADGSKPIAGDNGATVVTLRHFRAWMAELGDADVSQILRGHGRSTASTAATSRDLESDGRHGVRQFRMALVRHFDSLPVAWRAIDTNGDGVLQFREFCAACRKVSLCGNLKRIWEKLTEGEPDPELEEDERVARPEKLDPRLPGLLQGSLRTTSLRTAGTSLSSAAGRSSMTCWDPPPKEKAKGTLLVACDAKTFRASMVKKFGSLVAAWGELAPDGRHSLSYDEFLAGCRRVDFQGNFRQIFDDLAGDQGLVTPGALEPGLPFALRAASAVAEAEADAPQSSRGNRRVSLATQVGAARAAALAFDDPGPKFHSTRRRSAATLHEVHSALLAGDAKEGPPSSGAAFRSAIIKKFGSYAAAWSELDAR